MGPLLPSLVRIPTRTLADIGAERLTTAILSGELEPGERISEVEIAAKLGLSRGPVREAIRRLESQGLITIVPYKGATVTRLSTRDAYEVYAVMASLEGLALRIVIENPDTAWVDLLASCVDKMRAALPRADVNALALADIEFSEIVFANADHTRLRRLWEQHLKYQSFFLARAFVARVHPTLGDFVKNHERLVDLLRRRDAAGLRIFLERHLETVDSAFRRILSDGSDSAQPSKASGGDDTNS